MVDSPICLWVLLVSTAAINRRRRRLNPRSRVEKQRASIRRAAQGLGRESSQRFWTFGPERVLGPGQERQRSARAAAGSEDPRKIDSAWHIPAGWKKRELGLSQLTRVMYAVWEKTGAEDSNRKTTQMSADPHAVVVWGGCPATGILTRFCYFWVFTINRSGKSGTLCRSTNSSHSASHSARSHTSNTLSG